MDLISVPANTISTSSYFKSLYLTFLTSLLGAHYLSGLEWKQKFGSVSLFLLIKPLRRMIS